MKNLSTKRAFTLIELLIVVAIIAILAAIAVPNFLEAQTRSKVSRTKADMRTIATGIESYYVDNNRYPPTVAKTSPFFGGSGGAGINGESVFEADLPQGGVSSRFIWITTPIAYISSVFKDPFIDANVALNPAGNPSSVYDTYDYVDAKTFTPGDIISDNEDRGASITSGAQWRLTSAGPDKIQAFGGSGESSPVLEGVDYDPTNGTISTGDIVRIGGGPGPIFDEEPAINRVTDEYNF